MNSKIVSNASLGVREASPRRSALAGAAAVCAMLAIAGQAAGQLKSKDDSSKGDRPAPTPARVDPRPSSPPPRVETPRPSAPTPAPKVETPRPQPSAPPPRVEPPKPSAPAPQPQTPAPRVQQPSAPAKVVVVQPKQDAPPRVEQPKVVTPPRQDPPKTQDPGPRQPATPPRVEQPKVVTPPRQDPPKTQDPGVKQPSAPARVDPPAKNTAPAQPGKVVTVNPSTPAQPGKTPVTQTPPIRPAPGKGNGNGGGEVIVTPVKPAPSPGAPSGNGREITVKPIRPVVGNGAGGTIKPSGGGGNGGGLIGDGGPSRDGPGVGGAAGGIRNVKSAGGTTRVTRFSDNRGGRQIDDIVDDWAPGGNDRDGRDGDGRGHGGGRHDRDCDWDWWHHGRHHRHDWNFCFTYNWYSPTYVYYNYYYTSPYYWYDYTSPYYYPGYTIYATQPYAWAGWTRTYYGPRYFGWRNPGCGWRTWRAPGLSLWVNFGDYWGSGLTYSTYSPIVVDPAPRYEWTDFIGEVCDTGATYTTPLNVVNVDVPDFQPTLYRSDEVAGVMGWNDTPETVAGNVQSVPMESRGGASAQYLGRIPAGAWEVGYEGEKVVNGARELHFRGLTPNSKGQRVLIVVRPSGETPRLYAGQRVQITGRLSEICVDDPFEQAGRLVLSEGAVRY